MISLKTFTDVRGHLTVIEKVIPFEIRRIFWIYGVDNSVRGGHRHQTLRQAAVCLKGSCVVDCNDGKMRKAFYLNTPSKCLILEPQDWHRMYGFTPDAILMVFASENFDPSEYIYEEYSN